MSEIAACFKVTLGNSNFPGVQDRVSFKSKGYCQHAHSFIRIAQTPLSQHITRHPNMDAEKTKHAAETVEIGIETDIENGQVIITASTQLTHSDDSDIPRRQSPAFEIVDPLDPNSGRIRILAPEVCDSRLSHCDRYLATYNDGCRKRSSTSDSRCMFASQACRSCKDLILLPSTIHQTGNISWHMRRDLRFWPWTGPRFPRTT